MKIKKDFRSLNINLNKKEVKQLIYILQDELEVIIERIEFFKADREEMFIDGKYNKDDELGYEYYNDMLKDQEFLYDLIRNLRKVVRK